MPKVIARVLDSNDPNFEALLQSWLDHVASENLALQIMWNSTKMVMIAAEQQPATSPILRAVPIPGSQLRGS